MIYVILRFGIIVEYQLQVRDVFPIRLETGCPVGTEPRVEIQYLRPCDDDGPKRPIETERLSVKLSLISFLLLARLFFCPLPIQFGL